MKLKIRKALPVMLSLACLIPTVSNAQNPISGEWAINGHEVNHNIEYPNTLKSYLKAPRFYSQDDISSIAVGMSSDDVRSLLGNPHFNEFLTKKWNYIVGSVKNGVDFCQLQIHFDKNKLVSGIYWNTDACMSDYSSSNTNSDMDINLDSDSLSKAS